MVLLNSSEQATTSYPSNPRSILWMSQGTRSKRKRMLDEKRWTNKKNEETSLEVLTSKFDNINTSRRKQHSQSNSPYCFRTPLSTIQNGNMETMTINPSVICFSTTNQHHSCIQVLDRRIPGKVSNHCPMDPSTLRFEGPFCSETPLTDITNCTTTPQSIIIDSKSNTLGQRNVFQITPIIKQVGPRESHSQLVNENRCILSNISNEGELTPHSIIIDPSCKILYGKHAKQRVSIHEDARWNSLDHSSEF